MTVVQTASVLSDCNHHQLPRAKKFHENQIPDLDLVLQKKDKAIHWINHYPTDTCVHVVQLVLPTLIHWMAIYLADSVIQPANWPLVQQQELRKCLGSVSTVLAKMF